MGTGERETPSECRYQALSTDTTERHQEIILNEAGHIVNDILHAFKNVTH